MLQSYKEEEYNHILNITIVDDFLNKREIGAKPPSNYMMKFSKVNNNLDNNMKTHLFFCQKHSSGM